MKKKILVMSQNFDRSTDIVLQWFQYYGIPFIRINMGDPLKLKHIRQAGEETEILISHNHSEFYLSEIAGFWYRRGNDGFGWKELNLPESAVQQLALRIINKYLNQEMAVINDYFYSLLESLPMSLGRRSNAKNNKLIHLEMARSAGLKIPETLISSEKKTLAGRMMATPNITKAISNGLSIKITAADGSQRSYGLYTNRAGQQLLPEGNDNFFPTLLQGEIKKKFELRIFFLKGALFPMAIFSQNDPRTQVDFRHYNQERPNRMVPYRLAPADEDKIRRFMNMASLDTGSLDLICSSDDELYFLEVNPVGQFGMVSFPCVYYLEKRIAEYFR